MSYALQVLPKEQDLVLDKWTAKIRFNLFGNYWFYDLYLGETLVLAGQVLKPNTYPVVFEYLHYPKLFLVDTEPDNLTPPDALTDFGGRLELCQTDYTEA